MSLLDWQFIIAILLSMAPVIELRGGMPIAIHYALTHNISILLTFFLIVLANIVVIFIIFFFLDFLHEKFLKFRAYKRFSDFYLSKVRRKADNVEKKMGNWGFFALAIFVGIPLPGTGAWTGTIIAWLLGLERKRSILSIALGVLIAGILVFLATIGILEFIL